MDRQSGPIRALLASGPGGVAIIVAHDSPWLAGDIENVANSVADIGLDEPPVPGLWLWEGTCRLELESWDAPYPTELVYTGTLRPVTPEELPTLLAMEPPETCVVCGTPATTYYPDDESGGPSCGSPKCELQMQAGMDYHAEAGDRD